MNHIYGMCEYYLILIMLMLKISVNHLWFDNWHQACCLTSRCISETLVSINFGGDEVPKENGDEVVDCVYAEERLMIRARLMLTKMALL